MAINLGSPISADLMYKFYDSKAVTPQILNNLQKKENDVLGNFLSKSGSTAATAYESDKDKETDDKDSEKANKPGPATRVNINEQIIRMSMASKTAKPEDLKSRVKPSEEVLAIEKKLADQKAAEDAKKGE
jgi:hypothetical protein